MLRGYFCGNLGIVGATAHEEPVFKLEVAADYYSDGIYPTGNELPQYSKNQNCGSR